MNLADYIEQLMTDYSNAVDLSQGGENNSRKRLFKCAFCSRSYKFHKILTDHVFTKGIFMKDRPGFFDIVTIDSSLFFNLLTSKLFENKQKHMVEMMDFSETDRLQFLYSQRFRD